MTPQDIVDTVLRVTEPLQHPRGKRLPLYVWGLRGAPSKDDAETEKLLKALDARGLALCSRWVQGAKQQECLDEARRIARLQVRLGLSVGIDAIRPVYEFFNGDAETAHVDAAGKPFFEPSLPKGKIGCPFAVKHRYPAIREQVDFFAAGYKQAGLPIHFVFSDWEVDGPIEWNDSWANAKKCVRCRAHIPDIDTNFAAYQKACRDIRSEMQRECYAKPILDRFPEALVGNYGVYPCNGWRYWYDWFEKCNLDLPHKLDQREPQRPWVHEFEATGYTFAMPVMYTWYRTFDWYEFENPDYHWFYNMLKVASNAGAHTSTDVPIISFVHYTLTRHPSEPLEAHVKPMGEQSYQELLWHALLRGHDTFFLWCPNDQIAPELKLVHEVWAAALEYADFLNQGVPVTFEVPRVAGAVVSGLRLGAEVLVRRTDFGLDYDPLVLTVNGRKLRVPPAPGQCQVLRLDP